jgi:hypothetical protein
MKTSAIYHALKRCAADDAAVRRLLAVVDEVFEECRQIHRTVIRHMPEYTLHDEQHLDKTVHLMSRLIPSSTLDGLGPLELGGLMLAAGLHDIGMAPPEEEVRELLDIPQDGEKVGPVSANRQRYKAFREGFPAILARQRELREQGKHSQAQELEAYILSNYLRDTHAERGKCLVFERFGQKLVYGNFSFAASLADVCASHAEDPTSLDHLRCYELVRQPGEYVNWRFIAVVLRLADILDFDAERTPAVLFEHLSIRDNVSVREWRKHGAVHGWDIEPGRIALAARCPDPVIEKCIRQSALDIDRELRAARGVLAAMHYPACEDMRQRYSLDLPAEVDTRDVGPEQGPKGPVYRYVDLAFCLDEQSIMSLMMGLNLYGNRLLFLRELLQNAVDACRHRKALHEALRRADGYTPRIAVELCYESGKWFLAVEDNGMGMDEEILTKHFAQIGSSYYRSLRFVQERAWSGMAFEPISTFGIGVLSVFMVADQMRVQTRRLPLNLCHVAPALDVEIVGPAGLFWFRRSEREEPGTRIVLTLDVDPSGLLTTPASSGSGKKSAGKSNNDDEKATLEETVRRVAPHLEFPIAVRTAEAETSVTGRYVLPDIRYPHGLIGSCRLVSADLSSEAPNGLDGVVQILLLEDLHGNLSQWIEIEEDRSYRDPSGEELRDGLKQQCGYIGHVDVDYSEKQGRTEGWSVEFASTGRLSQNGFQVPHPLFVEHTGWAVRPEFQASIDYPFVVFYDVNLSGGFCLNLTADRLRPLPDQRFENVKRRICEAISELLFCKIGKGKTRESEGFFNEVMRQGRDPVVRDVFIACLKAFIGS